MRLWNRLKNRWFRFLFEAEIFINNNITSRYWDEWLAMIIFVLLGIAIIYGWIITVRAL